MNGNELMKLLGGSWRLRSLNTGCHLTLETQGRAAEFEVVAGLGGRGVYTLFISAPQLSGHATSQDPQALVVAGIEQIDEHIKAMQALRERISTALGKPAT